MRRPVKENARLVTVWRLRTDTRVAPSCAWGGEEGGACMGDGRPPHASCPRGNDKGRKGTRARCVFTRLGLRGFWGGERVGREEIESREEVGSRGPKSVDCGALARLEQSSYSPSSVRSCARACNFIYREDFRRTSRGSARDRDDPERWSAVIESDSRSIEKLKFERSTSRPVERKLDIK